MEAVCSQHPSEAAFGVYIGLVEKEKEGGVIG